MRHVSINRRCKCSAATGSDGSTFRRAYRVRPITTLYSVWADPWCQPAHMGIHFKRRLMELVA